MDGNYQSLVNFYRQMINGSNYSSSHKQLSTRKLIVSCVNSPLIETSEVKQIFGTKKLKISFHNQAIYIAKEKSREIPSI